MPTPQNGKTHSQTIHWQQPTNCLSVFEHFWGLLLKGLSNRTKKYNTERRYY